MHLLTRQLCRALVFAFTILFVGCAHLGPKSIAVDRFDYSSSIADSWKQQTLLNIVKLRYMDLPVFVDVSSVVAGYSLQTEASLNGTVASARAAQGNFVTAGGQVIYTDRPTVTYVPLTGEKFLRGLITPIDPKNIFFMLQSGYAADFILSLTIESLNGLRNRSVAGGVMRPPDPEFLRLAQLMREVQAAGAVGLRVEEEKAKGQTAVLVFRRDDLLSPDIVAKMAEIRRLLKLSPTAQKFTLTFSPMPGAADELAVNSRSLLQIMGAFASYLELPEAHIKDHSALPPAEQVADESRQRQVRVHSGREKPPKAFAAVRYRDYWFWIDESDWQTKRALTAVVFFFTLADTGGNEKLPLITIPAQ